MNGNIDRNGEGRLAWAEQDRERQKGEIGASGEGSGVRRRNGVHWWRMYWSIRNYTRGGVKIRFGTYHNWNGRN